MGPWSRVRVAKCQMLVTSLFVLLLGLAMATTAVLTYFGPHFAVIGHASSERTPYEVLHLWAFSAGIILAGLLTLGAVLSAAATVREAGGLMAGAFLCFALVFCALVQVAFWRFHNPTQVEDAVLDAYDQVYEQAVKSSSGMWRQELVAIQDMFQCCGKSPPLGLPEGSEADLCRGQEAARQDCLQGIRSFLRLHRNVVSALISLGLASTVYATLLSAFLWSAIRSGKYTLSPRARGCQPQEPCFYRRCQEGPAPHHPGREAVTDLRASPLLHPVHILPWVRALLLLGAQVRCPKVPGSGGDILTVPFSVFLSPLFFLQLEVSTKGLVVWQLHHFGRNPAQNGFLQTLQELQADGAQRLCLASIPGQPGLFLPRLVCAGRSGFQRWALTPQGFRVPTPASKAKSLPGCQDPGSETLEGGWEDRVAQKNSYRAAQDQNPGFAGCCLRPSLSPRAGGSSKAGAGAPQGPPGCPVSKCRQPLSGPWSSLSGPPPAARPSLVGPGGPFTASH
ncbi:tetraspanin-32 [Balaenoptera musculus]|uniref:Tetraspanin-32 n=1 Tax=Balaenoptera musculus TaxID=9771 RepID=A0A8B8Y633_BALMU|nr:tetraspanin-32 [Balaenoptera musculus]